MSTSRYKGFNILTRPYPLHDTGSWTADLEIRRSGRSQPFAVGGRYLTEDEAQTKCAGLGQRIIDGHVPGWSVEHLRVPPPAPRTLLEAWRQESMRLFLGAVLVILGLGVYAFLRLVRS